MLRIFLLLISFSVDAQAYTCTNTATMGICNKFAPILDKVKDIAELMFWLVIGLGTISFIYLAYDFISSALGLTKAKVPLTETEVDSVSLGSKVYGILNKRKLDEWSNYQSDGIHFSNDEFSRDEHLQYLEDKEAFESEHPEFEGSHNEDDRSVLFDKTSLEYDGESHLTVETNEQENRIEQENNYQSFYFRKDGELVDVDGEVVSEDEQLETNVDIYSANGELSFSVRDGQAIDVDSGEVVEHLAKEKEEEDNGWSYVPQESVVYQETEDEYQDRMEQAMIDLKNSR